MKSKFSLVALLVLFTFSVKGAVVEKLAVRSASMNKDVNVIVISPDNKQQSMPVIYLLHGYTGNANSWLGVKPELKDIADREGLIFVCPDSKNSWYWDSPKDPSSRYETFVSSELIQYIDSKYPTIKDRSGRAITGLSMGGHGAMWISLRHTDVFGAAGSTSGGLDFRPFPHNWDITDQLGKECDNQDLWDSHTAISQISRIKNGELAIIIDCGYSDFFLEVNNDFHNKLLKYEIDHDYIVRPGAHDVKYWKNSIEYQILFFKNFFMKQKNKK